MFKAPIVAIIACLALIAGNLHAQQFPANATPVLSHGAPSNGTNEVQTLTIGGTPTGGTFKVTFDGFATGAITWSATNATLVSNIQTALNALPNLADGEVTAATGTITAGIGTITLTFGGNRAKLAVNLMTVSTNSLTGTSPTAAITETTPGVTATGRGSAKGRLCVDDTNGALYQNTSGTVLAPTWVMIGHTTVPITAITDIAATTNITSVPGSFADLAAVQSYLAGANAVPNIETRLDNVEAKINAILAGLRTGGVIAP
jgi:hypothetical protein